jgi:hypothetical protein
MENTNLTWADIWVLQSIYLAPSDDAMPELKDILGFADAVNHAVVTFEEINNALYRLGRKGLLNIEAEKYILTDQAHELINNYSKQSYLKQRESICKKLGVEGWSKDYDPNVLETPSIFISRDEYENAVNSYQSELRVR